MYIIGSESRIGQFFMKNLCLLEVSYLKFMHTICLQAAYDCSSTQLYLPYSKLRKFCLMEEKEYNAVWLWMANLRKLDSASISTSRREVPLWETLQSICNQLLCSISVEGRDGRISIALDNDKLHLSMERSNMKDMFNLKYTTHVKANRKGFVGHTAVTTGANVPLQIVFEKVNSSSASSFKECLDGLFSGDGRACFRHVSVHSDRGYMLPNLVFEYLLKNGAEVVGTIKRMAQCWPFTYQQKLKVGDKRTLVDVKGAPSLFIKWCTAGDKAIFASAFRNGTDRVATAISTLHKGQVWEGIVMKNKEKEMYNANKQALISQFFRKVNGICFNSYLSEVPASETDNEDEHKNDPVQTKVDELLEEKIEPITLRQGKY